MRVSEANPMMNDTDRTTAKPVTAISADTSMKDTPDIRGVYDIALADWLKGIALIICSCVTCSLQASVIHYAFNLGYQSMQLLMFRASIQLCFTFMATIFDYAPSSPFRVAVSFQNLRVFQSIEAPLVKWVLLRGVASGLCAVGYYKACTMIPIGDAMTILGTHPLVAAVAGWLFLSERVSRLYVISLCAALTGIFLIANGTESHAAATSTALASSSWWHLYAGYGLSLLASVSGGFVFVFIRLAKNTNAMLLVYSYGAFCLLFSVTLGLLFEGFTWIQGKTLDTCLIAVSLGLLGFIGQCCCSYGSQLLPAAVASLLTSGEGIFTYIWQVVLFSAVPTVETIIGVICTLFGIVLVSAEKLHVAYRQHSQQKRIHAEQVALKSHNCNDGKKIMLHQYVYGSVNDK